MIKLEDVTHSVSDWGTTYLSLTKLTGKTIVDIKVRINNEFSNPTLEIDSIYLSDGTKLLVSGESDIAYIVDKVVDYFELKNLQKLLC